MVTAAPALPGSRIYNDHKHNDMKGSDKFLLTHPETFWQAGLEHAEKIGLGNRKYSLIEV
jgi:uncharacterized Fe-S center protein